MELKEKYAELEKEFGEKGAAILAGFQLDEQKNKALSGTGRYAENLEKFFKGRETAYAEYSEEQCALLKKLELFIISKGSAGNAGKALGVSPSILSGIRNCSYNGNTEEFFRNFESYSQLEAEKKKTVIYRDIEYAPTSISETIYQTLRSVHLNGECEIITGDAGIGKTRSIRKYVSDYARNTIAITPSCTDGTVSGALMLLADELGVSAGGSLNTLNRAVCGKLHDGMLIIVDEAQHLNFKAVDHLRTISTGFTEKGKTLGMHRCLGCEAMGRRKHSTIDMLDGAVKSTVEEMILSAQFTYKDIAEYIRDSCGTSISQSAICRYAQGFCKDMEAIKIAQENFRLIMQECGKYPDLDTTEGIVQITSNLIMSAVRNISAEDLASADPVKLIKQAAELVRAVSYKRNIDVKNKELTEAGFDAAKEKIFDIMEQDDPELYGKLAAYIEKKKEEFSQ